MLKSSQKSSNFPSHWRVSHQTSPLPHILHMQEIWSRFKAKDISLSHASFPLISFGSFNCQNPFNYFYLRQTNVIFVMCELWTFVTVRIHKTPKPLKPEGFYFYLFIKPFMLSSPSHAIHFPTCLPRRKDTWKLTTKTSSLLLFPTSRPSMICSVHARRTSQPTRPRREPRTSSQKWMKTTTDN